MYNLHVYKEIKNHFITKSVCFSLKWNDGTYFILPRTDSGTGNSYHRSGSGLL